MRDHSTHVSGSRHEVVDALLSEWHFAREAETVPVAQACGRVSAQQVVSTNQLPNWPTSKMDAVAVHFDDFAGGMPNTSAWVRGADWQFCNTGVAMPKGFDTAIRIEAAEVSADEESIKLNYVPQCRGESVTQVGAVLQPGDVLVEVGQVITPVTCSVLSMGGHTQVSVVKKPVVMFIPTGNELIDVTDAVPVGKNIDSNSALICAKLEQWGARPVRHPLIPDDPDQILAALRAGTAQADIVVINAGSSKGSDDFTCEILEREGRVLFHEVNQGPGRHCSFSVLDGKPVIGISGPPVGAEFTSDLFIKPFVDVYLGANTAYPPTVRARMLDSASGHSRPMTMVRRVAVRRTRDDAFVARAVALDDRPALRFADNANGLVFLGPNSRGWEPGDMVEVELRWPYTLPPYVD
ncbi:MAG: molybdopterin molybdotransferase MoeA [Coriobacteriia bacterium]|nr:molybdopterin molybdotransferase MoeA [Coriobacteriia bacterium]